MSDQHLDFVLPQQLLDLARRVVEENRAAGRRIATAESCTGGLVAAAITEIPGSSEVLETGLITYSNEAKCALLGVSMDVIETFGSVSVAVAWAMARGALAASDADVAVALTGIAGPAGGSDRKPVGTVVFARADRDADPKEIVADTKLFEDTGRGGVRLQAALFALGLLLPEEAA
jgi:nicotinamide-nucleotide amidase